MNRKSKIMVPLLLLMAALAFVSQQVFTLEPIFNLPWFTFDGGGGRSSGGSLEVVGTVGQPDAGVMSGGEFSLNGGFWQGPVATDAVADLSITHSVAPAVAEPGQEVVYTITYRNDGNAVATGVAIDYTKLTALNQVSFESIDGAVSVVDESNYVLQVADMAPGDAGTVVVTAVVDATISESMSLVSTAVISADSDGFTGNNRADATLNIQPAQYAVYLPAIIR
jgi:hypothetical protein